MVFKCFEKLASFGLLYPVTGFLVLLPLIVCMFQSSLSVPILMPLAFAGHQHQLGFDEALA